MLGTSGYTENKRISRKNENKLYILHLIDILTDLLLNFFSPQTKLTVIIAKKLVDINCLTSC